MHKMEKKSSAFIAEAKVYISTTTDNVSRRRRRASKEIWCGHRQSEISKKTHVGNEKHTKNSPSQTFKCWNILLTRIIKILSSSFSARSAPATARKMCKHSLKLVGYFQHFLILLENLWKFPTNSLVRSVMSCFQPGLYVHSHVIDQALDGQEWRAMISLQHHTQYISHHETARRVCLSSCGNAKISACSTILAW